ncbi:hypothetical protein [Streptomyces roseoverticillatus]|uniref:Uncharacterized protein n=1 Tax=Streptomyces roseoverticillatus TaxID=66429 RepID=A0ABV3IU47_9ACTN
MAILAAGPGNAELCRTCARFTDVSCREAVLQATRITLGLLTHRIGQLSVTAPHRIVFTRLPADPRAQDYYERRIKNADQGGQDPTRSPPSGGAP